MLEKFKPFRHFDEINEPNKVFQKGCDVRTV